MAEAELDYRALFQSAPGLYLVLSADLSVVTATDTYCQMTGIDWHALAGRKYFEILDNVIARRGSGESASLRASLDRVLETGRRDPMPLQRFDMPAQDGTLEERYWSVVNVPILDKAGKVRWIVHRVRDMTQSLRERETAESQRRLALEQEDLIEALRAANRELSDGKRARGDTERLARLDTVALMTSAIAHDISQPLAAATNYLSAVRRLANADDAGQHIQYVAKAEEQLARAGEIVRSLRHYIGGGGVSRKAESVAELVRRAAILSEPLFKQHHTQISVGIADDLPAVLAERVQIVQVLVNVFKNAAEAMHQPNERRITVTASATKETVQIEVADNGSGLLPELANRLFEPFRTSKSDRLGLGLAICREIVQAHDGSLSVRPNAERGTVVSIELPVA